MMLQVKLRVLKADSVFEDLPQVDDSPHVRAEPHGGAGVGLVLPDEDGVRDGQEADQRAVLEELQDF